MHHNRTFMIFWMFACILLVIAMILLGGATRLTESGLSIVEWRPLTGILPPLTDVSWAKEFEHYKTFPEYRFKHMGLSMEGFKFIFYMEYSHRLLGRLLGLIFILPLFFIWKNLSPHLKKQFGILCIVGCLQGVMGWFMVKSGLVHNPYVSHYRLAAHLFLAFVLLALFMKTLLILFPQPRLFLPQSMIYLNRFILCLVIMTIIYGAFVAGLRAGKLYNTFPTMGGDWIPVEIFFEKPFWINFFENPVTVQWIHRLFATLTFCCSLLFSLFLWWKNYKKESFLLFCFISVQFLLGALTVIHIVPIPLALMHQGGSIILFLYVFFLNKRVCILQTPHHIPVQH